MLRRHDPPADDDPAASPPAGRADEAAEPAAADHGSLLGRCLVAWTRVCLRAPLAVLVAAVLTAVV